MKLKLDENLPAAAQVRLAELGFDVHTVLDEQLGGRGDDVIWTAAQAEGRLLVTQDLDFSDVRRFAPGTHAGIFLLRLPKGVQRRTPDFLAACFSTPEARTWARCFVVATAHRIRVWRPIADDDSSEDDDDPVH